MPLKISIIDDHPIFVESYRFLIKKIRFPSVVTTYHDLEECHSDIFLNNNIPDIIFIDLSLPPFLNENLNDGFDLSNLIRQEFPGVKIIVSTMHSSPLYIYSIIEKIKPEAFLIKTDIHSKEMSNALRQVIAGGFYNSHTAVQALLQVKKYAFCDDPINRSLLLLTSQRFTNKEISETLSLSESTIEKRKAVIKQYLGIDGQNDRSMIAAITKMRLL